MQIWPNSSMLLESFAAPSGTTATSGFTPDDENLDNDATISALMILIGPMALLALGGSIIGYLQLKMQDKEDTQKFIPTIKTTGLDANRTINDEFNKSDESYGLFEIFNNAVAPTSLAESPVAEKLVPSSQELDKI